MADIANEPLSDHNYVSLSIGPSTSKKGPGVWKFDNSLLEDKEFIQNATNVMLDRRAAEEPTDPGSKWEWLKFKVREFSIQYAKELYHRRKGHEMSP